MSALHEILQSGRRYKIEKRQILQSTDDRQVVNLLVSGFIRRYMISNDGSVGVQIVYGPGDVFPLTIAFKALFNQDLYKGPETFFYEATSDVDIHSVNVDTLTEKFKDNPMLYADLLQESGKHLESCVQSLENLTLKTSYHRVAHQLLYFAKKFGKTTTSGICINMPLSHQAIADILSITRETVTNSMKELRKKNLIKSAKFITVTNIEKLQEEAYG